MDGIQTRAYCPECGAEVGLLLKKQEIPGQLIQMMEMLNLPSPGRENAYKGQTKCSCGKTVKITFVIEAFSENERPQCEFIASGGIT